MIGEALARASALRATLRRAGFLDVASAPPARAWKTTLPSGAAPVSQSTGRSSWFANWRGLPTMARPPVAASAAAPSG